MTTRRQHFSLPNAWQSLRGKVPFLGCNLEWDVPETIPKGLCLISSTFPFTTRHESGYPESTAHHVLRTGSSRVGIS